MIKAIQLVVIVFLTVAVDIQSQIIYVDQSNVNTTQNGSSWASSYHNLQDAIENAEYGDSIWVAKGKYYPDLGFNRDTAFNIKNGVRVFGGFAGNETSIGQRNVEINETILSGDIGEPDLLDDNVYTVVYINQADTSTILDGFTITEGNADVNGAWPLTTHPQRSGGGIYVDGSGIGNHSSPQIRNCTIFGNQVDYYGADIYYSGHQGGSVGVILKNCQFLSGSNNVNGNFSIALYKGSNNSFDHIIIDCVFKDIDSPISLVHYEENGSFRILNNRFHNASMGIGHNFDGSIQIVVKDNEFVDSNITLSVEDSSFISIESNKITFSKFIVNGSAIMLYNTIEKSALRVSNYHFQVYNSLLVYNNLFVNSIIQRQNYINNDLLFRMISVNNTYIFDKLVESFFFLPSNQSAPFDSILWNGDFINDLFYTRPTDTTKFEHYWDGRLSFKNCIFNDTTMKNESWSDILYIEGYPPFIPNDTLYRETVFTENRFVENMQLMDPENGDFRLRSCSPAIDIGDSFITDSLGISSDYFGNERFIGIVDAGAIEHPSPFVEPHVLIWDPPCFGDLNGIIKAIGGHGALPLNYTLGNSSNGTGYFKDLSDGFYQLIMRDAEQCEFVSDTVQIVSPEEIQIKDLVLINEKDNLSNGGISYEIFGGTPPYTFLWDNGSQEQNLTDISAGSYAVTISDANDCEYIKGPFIIENILKHDSTSNSIFQIYPNPVDELLYIIFSHEINEVNFELFDLFGRNLFSSVANEQKEIEIDIAALALEPQMIILRMYFEHNDNPIVHKIIVQTKN